MQVAGLSPLLQQALIAAIAKPLASHAMARAAMPDMAPPPPHQAQVMQSAMGSPSIPLLIATAEVERPSERRRLT